MIERTEEEQERRNRIRLTMAAYAYEFLNISMMSDDEYDKLSLEIRKDMSTGNKKLDEFFSKEFDPSTGMWIRKHPELDKVADTFNRHYMEKFK